MFALDRSADSLWEALSRRELEAELEAIHRVGRTGDDDPDPLHGATLLEAPSDDDSTQSAATATAALGPELRI